MVELDGGGFAFHPDTVRARQSDRVRWHNESGGPHNVAFYADQLSDSARIALNAAMPERLGDADVVGKLLFDHGETYEIALSGVPPGTYAYYCTPHEMVGMKATLVVTR